MTISLQKQPDGTWADTGKISIKLPPKRSVAGASLAATPGRATVFIGPNGSGKTRFAGWLEKNQDNIFYIRARRNVVMPSTYTVSSEEDEYITIVAGTPLPNHTRTGARNFRP